MSDDDEKQSGQGESRSVGRSIGTSEGSGESVSRSEHRSWSVSRRSWAEDPAARDEQQHPEQALLRAELARLAGDLSVPATVDIAAGADTHPDDEIVAAQFTFQVSATELATAARRILRRRPEDSGGQGAAVAECRTTSTTRQHGQGESVTHSEGESITVPQVGPGAEPDRGAG